MVNLHMTSKHTASKMLQGLGERSLPNGVIGEDFRKVQQLSQALKEGLDLTSKDKQERIQGRCSRITKAEAGVEGLSELLSG